MTKHYKSDLIVFQLIVVFLASMMIMVIGTVNAQTLPFTFQNTSGIADDQLYVTVVGEDLTGPPGARFWVNCKTGAALPMSPGYNTMQGPVYGGNKGPGNNAMYADCFTKLSDVPNRTVNVPKIQGCRVYISIGKPLYLYFFGASGAVSGYSSPNPADATDPNQNIQYEIVELTNGSNGFFGNSSRVDSYNYAVGLELFSTNNGYIKVGELKNHKDIGTAFLASVPNEFKGCYQASSGQIMCPSKTPAFAAGGQYENYLKPYIDQIWAKYTNEDLIFTCGVSGGIWKGRVVNGKLTVVNQSGGSFPGRTGVITHAPTTDEVFEGKGVLKSMTGDGPVDLFVQTQICAAINRHVISVANGAAGTQDFFNASKYYQTAPYNYYAKFWHEPGISVNQFSYGFAYDDVNDQSSTIQSSSPIRFNIVFGGFAPTANNKPPAVSLTGPANNATFIAPATISLTADAADTDGTVTMVQFYQNGNLIGAANTSPYTYSWTPVAVGNYNITAVATDNLYGTATSTAVNITVTAQPQTPYNGTVANIPGIVEAEFFDLGGEGVAYHDVTNANEGANGGFRAGDGVDTEIYGSGHDVGYVVADEWLEYTVNVSAGTYKIEAFVATVNSGKTFRLELDGTSLGNFTVPNTNGWGTFQPTALNNVTLTAGKKILRFYATSSDFNIDKIIFTSLSTNINDVELSKATAVYPNPTTGIINIGSDVSSVEILNVNGASLGVDYTAGAEKLDISTLTNGIYILKITTDTQTRFERVVKM